MFTEHVINTSGVYDTLKKSAHKLYAFSNGSTDAVTNLLINADLYDLFDDIVSVKDVQVVKPSPLVYKHFNKEMFGTKIQQRTC